MGSTLEIDFDINDYYTQEDYGAGVTHFDFDGWYNDGGWNDYKAGNPNNTLPDSITINGWTNIIGMVNDYEKKLFTLSSTVIPKMLNNTMSVKRSTARLCSIS